MEGKKRILKAICLRLLALSLSVTIAIAIILVLGLLTTDSRRAYENNVNCQNHIFLKDLYPYGPSLRRLSVMTKHVEARGSRPKEYLGIQTTNTGFRYQRGGISPLNSNIAVLGGSEIWGEGLREADTLPNIIGRNLKGSKVFNFGIPAGTSEMGIRILKEHLQKGYRPKTVVFAYGVNDSTIGSCREGTIFWIWRYLVRHLRKYELTWYLGGLSLGPGTAERVSLQRYLEIHEELIELSERYNFSTLILQEAIAGEKKLRRNLTKVLEGRKNYHEFLERCRSMPGSTVAEDRYKASYFFANTLRYQDAIRKKYQDSWKNKPEIEIAKMNDGIHRHTEESGISEYDLFQMHLDDRHLTKQDPIHPCAKGMEVAAGPAIIALQNLGWQKREQETPPDYRPIKPLPYKKLTPKTKESAQYYLVTVIVAGNGKPIRIENREVSTWNKNLKAWKPVTSSAETYILSDTDFTETNKISLAIKGKLHQGKVTITNEDAARIRMNRRGRDLYLIVYIEDIGIA